MRPPDISIHALREEGDARKSWRRTTRSYFYPRPPRGGQPSAYGYLGCRLQISIHALREEGDSPWRGSSCTEWISIHALREEGDRGTGQLQANERGGFLSTPSARRATCYYNSNGLNIILFLSTPSARRATGRAGGEDRCGDDFYPRPPRGGRQLTTASWQKARLFLSTPSARRTTTLELSFYLTFQNFYPRPPRGGRRFCRASDSLSSGISIHALREEGDQWDANVDQLTRISIHALREEGDTRPGRWGSPRIYFYPRPPRGGRPRQPARSPSSCNFYPRPPRGGRLFVLQKSQIFFDYFYPRPPRGGRREKSRTKFILEKFLSTPSARRATEVLVQKLAAYEFLSTPSARRATRGCRSRCGKARISIHALREEGDCSGTPSPARSSYFYPRPPRGGRLTSGVCSCLCRQISIHALREEGDSNGGGQGKTVNDFYPRPPRGGRQVPASVQTIAALFLSTPSARRATAHSL